MYRDNAPKKSAVYKWIPCFKKGHDDVEDEASNSGSPISIFEEKN